MSHALLELDGGIQELKDSYLPKHIRCTSRTLNLIAITDVSNIISKPQIIIRDCIVAQWVSARDCQVWATVSRSTTPSDFVETIVEVPLRARGKRRWNSTYDAIKLF